MWGTEEGVVTSHRGSVAGVKVGWYAVVCRTGKIYSQCSWYENVEMCVIIVT